jgi:hypothetical protein
MHAKVIGVFPAHERTARRALFDSLEEALAVRLEGRESGDYAGLDAALLLPGSDPAAEPPLPHLIAVAGEGPSGPQPRLGERYVPPGTPIELTAHAPLDRRLRGARLRDVTAEPCLRLEPAEGDTVLAARGDDPLWLSRQTAHGTRQQVAIAPDELEAGEALRDRVRDGRFLATVALVHFLREVSADVSWRPPPVSACFLFDDPNLHWTSYGYVRYKELLREADRHGYHMAFAMVPLDGWFVSSAARRLFRERPDRLSLVVHGNNHTKQELLRADTTAVARALLRQAQQRIARFERRSGVGVARIMVPPHGVCSREIGRNLVPMGFDALCISRPYPWLARPPQPWLIRPEESSPLTGWHPASVIENGLPVLLRRGINDPAEDLCLRAFLDQPLIIMGHHGDVEAGLDQLAEVTARLGRLGDIEWKSPGEIAAANVATRLDGDTLQVRMFTRRATVTVPEGVDRLAVSVAALDREARTDAPVWTASTASGRAPARETTDVVEVTLDAPEPPAGVTAPGFAAWPVARRLLAEGRDRLEPLHKQTVARARTGLRLSAR